MKKNILTITTLLCFMLALIIFSGCNPVSSKKEENNAVLHNETDGKQISAAEKWLKSIFQCLDEQSLCFPDEQKVTTMRYFEFFTESLDIYEYPDFETESERIAAEESFKKKWGKIYPLDLPILSPFGRGNGIESGQKLNDVSITSISDTKYTLIINYGDNIKTTSEVTLVANGNSFLIDYMKSEFIK